MDGKNVDFCWEWRPLAGMKKISLKQIKLFAGVFPSPRGDKENLNPADYDDVDALSFRPLAGIKKIPKFLQKRLSAKWFPSPRGDKENPIMRPSHLR